MTTLADAAGKFLAAIPAKVWAIVLLALFIFLLGVSVGNGCAPKARPATVVKADTLVRWDTLPVPPPFHDTVRCPVLQWRHDTIAIAEPGHPVNTAAIAACESFDTVTPQGTRCGFRQCFLLPDSVIRRAAQPPVFEVRERAPVEKVVTKTVVEMRETPRPVNWTVELLKAGVFAGLGIWAGSRL